jgi:hypothetical protein
MSINTFNLLCQDCRDKDCDGTECDIEAGQQRSMTFPQSKPKIPKVASKIKPMTKKERTKFMAKCPS